MKKIKQNKFSEDKIVKDIEKFILTNYKGSKKDIGKNFGIDVAWALMNIDQAIFESFLSEMENY